MKTNNKTKKTNNNKTIKRVINNTLKAYSKHFDMCVDFNDTLINSLTTLINTTPTHMLFFKDKPNFGKYTNVIGLIATKSTLTMITETKGAHCVDLNGMYTFTNYLEKCDVLIDLFDYVSETLK